MNIMDPMFLSSWESFFVGLVFLLINIAYHKEVSEPLILLLPAILWFLYAWAQSDYYSNISNNSAAGNSLGRMFFDMVYSPLVIISVICIIGWLFVYNRNKNKSVLNDTE